jgi:2'-5' RNA ligase
MIDSMATRELEALAERWQSFQSLGHLTDHWYWRPGWRVGRSFYTWHLTFEDATGLHELVSRLQEQIATPAHDLVPLEGLHLTMQGVGFTDEVKDVDVSAIVEAARARLAGVAAFTLSLGPVDPDAEGVGLLVRPWAPVEGVRLAIRDAIADVWGEVNVPEDRDGFRPHVTLAYSATDAPAEPVRGLLEPLRDIAPATVQINQAQLIRLNRDERVYRWDVVASAPLASGVGG